MPHQLDNACLLAVIQAQTEIIRRGPDLGAIMTAVTEHAVALTGAAGAVIELAEGAQMVYRAVAGSASGQLGLRVPVEGSLSGLCVRSGRPEICVDALDDPRVDRISCARVGLRSMVVVPLFYMECCVGALKVLSPQAGSFDTRTAAILEQLCGLVAAAVFHAAALDASELYRRATSDALTGLSNRAMFYDRLRQQIALADRHGQAFGVIVADMDGLKTINDRLGHRAGDGALTEVGRALRAVCRIEDVVARLGGDEFAVMAPSAGGREQLAVLARRIGNAVAECHWQYDGRPLPLGVSVGYACFPEDSADLDSLVDDADRAMYDIKRVRKAALAAAN